MVHVRYFWQGNHQIYGHTLYISSVLANPSYMLQEGTSHEWLYFRLLALKTVLLPCFSTCTPMLSRSFWVRARIHTHARACAHICTYRWWMLCLCALPWTVTWTLALTSRCTHIHTHAHTHKHTHNSHLHEPCLYITGKDFRCVTLDMAHTNTNVCAQCKHT
jgi:hypothetical protein